MTAGDRDEHPGPLTEEGALDRGFLSDIGIRIRLLRSERSLTVQQLADRAQLSRRLLTQIELGQANPSLVTVTRIARQLGTDFTTLLEPQTVAAPVRVQDATGHVLVWSSPAGSTAHLLVAAAPARTADLWRWRLVAGDTYQAQADPARSQELFYVLAGSLTLVADDQPVVVPAGSSARLRSDRRYSYTNTSSATAEFVRVVALAT